MDWAGARRFRPVLPADKAPHVGNSTGRSPFARQNHHYWIGPRRLYGRDLRRARLAGAVLISGFEPGGQLMVTADVENYPGFAAPVQGPWLMEQMKAQAENAGTRMVADHIVEVELGRRPFRLQGDGGAVYTCDTLVIATGAKAKWLGIPSETKFKGYGVSACATCDGFFYRGKPVVVVGGGNTAVEEALYLSHIAAKVTIVHRRDSFRAERILQDRLFKRPNVEVIFDHVVDEIRGTSDPLSVSHVRLRNVKTGETRDHRNPWRFCRDRTRARLRSFQGPARDQAERLHQDGAFLDRHERARCLRGRRRHRRYLPPGRDRGGSWLHGRDRGGALACRGKRRTGGAE